jgi:hypothetical protein
MNHTTLLVAIYRAFDIRLMLSTRIIQKLAQNHQVTIMTSTELIPLIRGELGSTVEYTEMKYLRSKEERRGIVNRFFSRIFQLTYGNTKIKSNATRDFHIRNYKGDLYTLRMSDYLFRWIVIAISNLACRSRVVRKLLLRLAYSFLTSRLHQALFDELKPKLLIVCSLGISYDALLMREARRNRVPILSIIQSWDKTSTKGYPLAEPNYVVVWSRIMAEEAAVYHDVPRDRVYIGGVPQWDHYFSDGNSLNRKEFCEKHGLDPKRKIIYFALCSPAYHKGNMEASSYLVDCLDRGRFEEPAQIILRMHPKYFNRIGVKDPLYRELTNLLDQLGTHQHVFIHSPKVKPNTVSYMLFFEDDIQLMQILSNCDVCLSVASTQMLEATIFDKPSISIEYGRWKTNFLDNDLREMKLEHLKRIHRVGAILRAHSKESLLKFINDALCHPERLLAKRRDLVDQEIPVHRGVAADKIVRCISSLAAGKGFPLEE